jgi:hypothetical protein
LQHFPSTFLPSSPTFLKLGTRKPEEEEDKNHKIPQNAMKSRRRTSSKKGDVELHNHLFVIPFLL